MTSPTKLYYDNSQPDSENLDKEWFADNQMSLKCIAGNFIVQEENEMNKRIKT